MTDAARTLTYSRVIGRWSRRHSDDDLYVMVNAYWEPLEFVVQEGRSSEWQRVVDTAQEGSDHIREPDRGVPLTLARYTAGPRSVVVLVRPRSL